MQGEHCIMIAKFCHEKCFADSLGRKQFRFLKQHYKQMTPAQLPSHLSVCGFYTIYAAFYICQFSQEVMIGVHEYIVLCFRSKYM